MKSVHWATGIAASLLLSTSLFAQQPMLTADQILDKYVQAVGGAQQFSGIKTWSEKWEVTGDLTEVYPAGRSPTPFKSHGTGGFYFKAPNLRVEWVQSDQKQFTAALGCDGKNSWTYSPLLGMRKQKPTADHRYVCREGMGPLLPLKQSDALLGSMILSRGKARLALKGQKEVAGRATFVIRAELPDQPGWDLYVDSENYLLVRVELLSRWTHPNTIFSDYRDVAGIKVPFHIETHNDYGDKDIKVHEVQVNVPIDDQVFRKPNW
ncbi:MAG: hypothetical protein ACRD3B_18550 [Candidatus Sulfotelmatobacter sp.]